VRINPEHCDVPRKIERGVSLKTGWEVLADIKEAVEAQNKTGEEDASIAGVELAHLEGRRKGNKSRPQSANGGFDESMLLQLLMGQSMGGGGGNWRSSLARLKNPYNH